jgi:hypothetical protein
MQNKKFVEAYPEKVPAFTDASPKLIEALEPAANWSSSFGSELHAFLGGSTPGEQRSTTLIRGYYHALHNLLKSIEINETALEELPKTDENWRVIHSLGFHSLTAASIGIWHHVLSGKQVIPRSVTHEAQINTAVGVVHDMEERVQQINEVGYLAYIQTVAGKRMDGEMTEGDAYVAALEITKKHPNIAILPAPLQFESSRNSRKNMDLVAIDLQRDFAYGIQVKTQTDNGRRGMYDPNYTMVLDGKIDLDNVKATREVPTKTKEIQVAWPGLISTHFLRQNPHKASKKATSAHFSQNRVAALQLLHRTQQARHLASKLAGQTKPRVKEAGARIEDRLLNNIYK